MIRPVYSGYRVAIFYFGGRYYSIFTIAKIRYQRRFYNEENLS